jgi:phage-related minor tail protein
MLVTFQNTGVKLKLIQALFNGRFIVANKAMIEDTGLEKYVTIANTPEEQLQAMEALFSMEMDDEQLRLRSGMLNDLSDRQGARLIADRLFPGARPEAPH